MQTAIPSACPQLFRAPLEGYFQLHADGRAALSRLNLGMPRCDGFCREGQGLRSGAYASANAVSGSYFQREDRPRAAALHLLKDVPRNSATR